MKTLFIAFCLMLTFGFATPALAWEKHGHSLICEAAAYALAGQTPFLKSVSFDLGYYCNVPDMIWKREKTYKIEREEHFMDLEIFKRAMGDKPEWIKDRVQFFKKYPAAKESGTAFWRISELCQELGKIRTKIEAAKSETLISEWLTVAGTLGHYVGDLAQPLHTTENYDGQLTGQKGVHAYYEANQANEIFPEITSAIFNRVNLDFKDIKNKENMDCFDLSRELADLSFQEVPALLESDKKLGRSDLKKAVAANQPAIVKQMSRGSVYLAVIWQKYLPSNLGMEQFHTFAEAPKYPVPPGKVK
jgi:hypothetical protein